VTQQRRGWPRSRSSRCSPLADENHEQLAAGVSGDGRFPEAVAAADRAFGLLRHGLADQYD
jgi:hypothetical protein